MTQPIVIDDVLQITVEGEVEQQPWNLVRHYIVTQVTDVDTLLAMIDTYWETTILQLWEVAATDLWNAQCHTITRVAPQPMNAHFHNYSPAVVGDVTTDGLPGMNAALVRLLTDEVGPRNRGRSYLSGVPEASTNGNVLLAANQAEWQAVADELKTTITDAANTVVPVIFSRTEYDPTAIPPQAATVYTSPITSAPLQGNIATIRRRRARRSTFSA